MLGEKKKKKKRIFRFGKVEGIKSKNQFDWLNDLWQD